MNVRWRSMAIVCHRFAPNISAIDLHKPEEFDPLNDAL